MSHPAREDLDPHDARARVARRSEQEHQRERQRTQRVSDHVPPPSSGISMLSSAELSPLPCASSDSERVTPPPSAPSSTKLSAPSRGSSYRVTSPRTIPAKCAFTCSAVTWRASSG